MKYWFISDDAFLLCGLKATVENNYPNTKFINVREYSGMVYPGENDVVILAVSDNHIRSRVLNLSAMSDARLAIMVDVPLERSYPGSFPCLLSKRISPGQLRLLLELAENMPVRKRNNSVRELNIFLQLGYGDKMDEITGAPYLSSKSIYRIKRKVLQNYGLTSCNSLGVLICRDMLMMTHSI